jgi:hypothetical protein
MELLLSRMEKFKISHWSRIGRLKRTNIPSKKFDTSGSSYSGG